jgi:hypothetical protein
VALCVNHVRDEAAVLVIANRLALATLRATLQAIPPDTRSFAKRATLCDREQTRLFRHMNCPLSSRILKRENFMSTMMWLVFIVMMFVLLGGGGFYWNRSRR